MLDYVEPVTRLIDQLERLPGIGRKSAQRLAFYILRANREEADRLIDAINASGYGLTLGVHTRIDSFAERVAGRARVGNVYVNRNMIGAQVGVQPFGGMGLSGTGPKAGGPHYVPRFATEQTLTVNTAAVGGNATLLSLGSDEPDNGTIST